MRAVPKEVSQSRILHSKAAFSAAFSFPLFLRLNSQRRFLFLLSLRLLHVLLVLFNQLSLSFPLTLLIRLTLSTPVSSLILALNFLNPTYISLTVSLFSICDVSIRQNRNYNQHKDCRNRNADNSPEFNTGPLKHMAWKPGVEGQARWVSGIATAMVSVSLVALAAYKPGSNAIQSSDISICR